MRDAFVKTLMDIASRDKNVYLVTGDLGFGVLKPFWEMLPDQFINAGIAEQNMTSMAAGMALEGKIVFTYSIANFPTLRCLEQIRNDCAYHNANVKIVCVGGGLEYGSLGVSHHATEDLSIMRSLPGVKILAPGDWVEAECATRAVYNQQGTCYLRLGRGGETRIHEKIFGYSLGDSIKIKEGEKVVVISTGTIFNEALAACAILEQQGMCPALYTFPTVKPIDRKAIISFSKTFELIVSVEENNIMGGFGSAVAEVLSELDGKRTRLLRIGLDDQYSNTVGTQKYLREVYGMNAAKIAERILNTCDQRSVLC